MINQMYNIINASIIHHLNSCMCIGHQNLVLEQIQSRPDQTPSNLRLGSLEGLKNFFALSYLGFLGQEHLAKIFQFENFYLDSSKLNKNIEFRQIFFTFNRQTIEGMKKKHPNTKCQIQEIEDEYYVCYKPQKKWNSILQPYISEEKRSQWQLINQFVVGNRSIRSHQRIRSVDYYGTIGKQEGRKLSISTNEESMLGLKKTCLSEEALLEEVVYLRQMVHDLLKQKDAARRREK